MSAMKCPRSRLRSARCSRRRARRRRDARAARRRSSRRRRPRARVGVVQRLAEGPHRAARAGSRAAREQPGIRSSPRTASSGRSKARPIAAGRSIASMPPALHQRDAVAADRLVHVGRGDHDRSGPSPRSVASRSQNSRRETASTPVVGSSRNRISGRCTRAQQSASFCFMPPESAPARRAEKRLELDVDRRDRARTPPRPSCRTPRRRTRDSPPRSGRDRARTVPACSRSRVRISQRSLARRPSPSTAALPASGRSSVARMRNSVVFPAPSGPMNPNSSPGPTSNDTSSSAASSPKRCARCPAPRPRAPQSFARPCGMVSSPGMPILRRAVGFGTAIFTA